MRQITLAICWLVLGGLLVPSFAQAAQKGQARPQGTWTAIKAESDGKLADEIIGHRLSFTKNRFQIHSKDRKLLYSGIVRVSPSAKPAAIDFEHTRGVLKKKVWKGIYRIEGDTLIICNNAPNLKKNRPAAFEAKSGSGYVLITFKRTKP